MSNKGLPTQEGVVYFHLVFSFKRSGNITCFCLLFQSFGLRLTRVNCVVLVHIRMIGITVGAAWPADDRHEKVLYDVILNLLRIRDEHQMDRIRVAFEEPSVGILPMIKDALVEVRSGALKAW